MFKITFMYEECRSSFNRMFCNGKIPLNEEYYCKRFADIHGVKLSKHPEINKYYKRFEKEKNIT